VRTWAIQNDTCFPGKGWVVTVGSVWYAKENLCFPAEFEQANTVRSLLFVVVFQQHLNGRLDRSEPPTLMEGVQNE